MSYNGPVPLPIAAGGTNTNSLAGGVLSANSTQVVSSPIDPYAILSTDASGITMSGLAPGLATQALLSNGSGTFASFGTTGGAFALIQSQTVTSPVASVVFNTNISTIYNLYMLIYYNWSASVTARALQIQFSDDGGATFPANNYLSGGPASAYNSTTINNFNGGGTSFRLSRATNTGGPGPRFNGGGTVYLMGLNSDRMVSVMNACMDAGNPEMSYGGGTKALSNINAFQILLTSAGNITSGTFVLYGLRETANPT